MRMKARAAGAALALALVAGSASGQEIVYDQAGHALARVAPAIGTASGVSVEPGALPWRVDFSGAACGFVWHNGSVPDPFFMPLASEAETGSLFSVIGAGTHPAAASTNCCQPGQETAPADAASPCGYSRMVNSGKVCGNTTAWAKIACSLDPPPPGEDTTPTPVSDPPGGGGDGQTGGCYSTYLEVWFRIGTMGGAPALDTVQLECPAGMQARDDRAGWGPNPNFPGSNTNWYSSLGAAQAAPATACVSRPAACGA